MGKKHVILITVAAVLSVAVAALGGYLFCTQIGIPNAELYALIPVYVILAGLCSFLVELIHEGAHLLMGVICSMGIKATKIRIFRSSSIDIYPYGTKRMKARMVLTSAAGLFFTFLLIALGVIAICVKSVPIVFVLPMPYALYSFIVNAAPVEYESGKTDGLMIWELITNKPTAQVLLAILCIQGKVHSGALIQELDEGMFLDVPQLPEDDVNFIILTQLRYEYYLAKGNDSEAYKYFCRYQEIIKYLPEGYKEKK